MLRWQLVRLRCCAGLHALFVLALLLRLRFRSIALFLVLLDRALLVFGARGTCHGCLLKNVRASARQARCLWISAGMQPAALLRSRFGSSQERRCYFCSSGRQRW